MTAIVQIVVLLTGALEGKDFDFREYQFRGGKLSIAGTPEEVALHRQYLERNLSTRVEGEPVAAQEPPSTADNADAKPTSDNKLAAAIAQLDHANDEHWTQAGKPALAAVEQLYGSAGVTRADVEAAAPGFVRDAK